eukprot:CCRYP_018673-RA/>CCRYP_018673-RA protein AED:0.44 eAED:0.64 QI:0/0/0/0.5/1/1/4/0/733
MSPSLSHPDNLSVKIHPEPTALKSSGPKAVRFSSTCEVKHVSNPSADAISERWYSKEDLGTFMKIAAHQAYRCSKMLIFKSKQGLVITEEERELCVGIEHLLSSDAKKNVLALSAMRKRHLYTVLVEQARQKHFQDSSVKELGLAPHWYAVGNILNHFNPDHSDHNKQRLAQHRFPSLPLHRSPQSAPSPPQSPPSDRAPPPPRKPCWPCASKGFEESIFKAASSLDDYKKSIQKRLKKLQKQYSKTSATTPGGSGVADGTITREKERLLENELREKFGSKLIYIAEKSDLAVLVLKQTSNNPQQADALLSHALKAKEWAGYLGMPLPNDKYDNDNNNVEAEKKLRPPLDMAHLLKIKAQMEKFVDIIRSHISKICDPEIFLLDKLMFLEQDFMKRSSCSDIVQRAFAEHDRERTRFTVEEMQRLLERLRIRKKLARFAGVNFKQGATMAQKAIEDMVTPVFNNPPDPDVAASPVVVKKWKVQYNELQSEKKAWKDAGPGAYQLLLVHCHPNMEQKLVASEKFANINAAQDPVGLLKMIRSIAHKHEEEKGGTMARVEHDIQLYLCYQKPNMSNVDYFKTFKAIRAVVDVHGGRAGFHRGVFEERRVRSRKKTGWDQDLKRTLDNAHLFGNDDYPTLIEDGLRMMENHKPSHSSREQNQLTTQVSSSGVTFAQPGQTNRTGRQRDISKDKCFNCNEMGHHAKDCQKDAGDGGNERQGPIFSTSMRKRRHSKKT